MKQMRWRVILLALWLTLLFNIERVDIEKTSPVNLATPVYVLAMATVAFFMLVPLRRRQMYLASSGVLMLYATFKVLHGTPFLSGVQKYLTITEAVALLITAGLAWLVSQALYDFEQAVEAISMPEGRSQLLSYDKVQERIRAEMGRARRHQRPISVAMIDLDPSTFEAALHQAVRDAQAAMIERYVQVRLGLFLTKHVRETDVIAYQADGGRFLLVAPETPAEQTAAMLKRLARVVEDQMGIRFRYSIADFPKGALTSEELIRKVTEELQAGSPAFTPSSDGSAAQPAATGNGAHPDAAVARNRKDEVVLTCALSDKEAGDGPRSYNGKPS